MGNTSSQSNSVPLSRSTIADPFAGQPDAFRVFVTTRKRKLISGTLKVTENEIMFFRSGEETLVWPLHFLRRYGFTSSGVFSFESGRRCSTGEGLYSFTTQHAERIFQLVQSRIQDNANLSAAMRDSRAQSTTSSMQSLITIPSNGGSGGGGGGTVRIHPVQRYSSEGSGAAASGQPLILTARGRPRSLATPPLHSTAWPTPINSDADDDIFGTVVVPARQTTTRASSATPTQQVLAQQQYINVVAQQKCTARPNEMNGAPPGSNIFWRQVPNSVGGTTVIARHSAELPPMAQGYANLRRGTPETPGAIKSLQERDATPPQLDYAAVNVGSATLPMRSGSSTSQRSYMGPAHHISYATVDLDKTRALEETAMSRLLYTRGQHQRRIGQINTANAS